MTKIDTLKGTATIVVMGLFLGGFALVLIHLAGLEQSAYDRKNKVLGVPFHLHDKLLVGTSVNTWGLVVCVDKAGVTTELSVSAIEHLIETEKKP